MARVLILIGCAAAMAALAAGCAGQVKRERVELAALGAWLPGYYDNQAQVRADTAAGRPGRAALRLAMIPVDAELIGTHVYYLQETTAGRTPHVTMQRLVAFTATPSGILESQWSFTDPTRWIGAAQSPELFTALQPGDVRHLEGCDLKWTRQGGRFEASDDPHECRIVSAATGRVEAIDTRIELDSNELAISSRDRRSRASPGVDSYVRFRRDGGPP